MSSRKLEHYVPVVKLDGLNTNKPVTFGSTLAVTGAVTFSGAVTASGGLLRQVENVAADKVVTSAMSGRMFVNTKGATTTTFTLPAAEAGLTYTFVEGNAAGEILITPATGDAIVGKIHAAQDGTALAPAAGTGIKNTAATNVAGDTVTITALDATTWYITSQTGLWASQ